jgi:RHS repeat-associated protein
MTDDNGNVVWRADYKPFGEEKSITGTIENNEKFVGKEKDKETGLYYFGARYMKAEIGRFTSPDPVGPVDAGTSKTSYSLLSNPQNLNRYAYSLNNPYKYLDPNGKWPEWIHNSIINAAFSKGKYKLDQKFIAALKRGSANVDKDQSLESSYKHAMSSPYYDKEHAEKYMNNFIEKKMNEYKTLMSQGNEEAAYFVLGEAMHPIMDSTSPSHTGFQEWRGLDGTIELGEGISHGLQESIIAIDRFRITVNKIKEFYSDIK